MPHSHIDSSWLALAGGLKPSSPMDLLNVLPYEAPRNDAEWDAFEVLNGGGRIYNQTVVVGKARVRLAASLSGGQATVFFGRYEEPPQRPVAIKCLRLNRSQDLILQTRFDLERHFLDTQSDRPASYWPRLLDQSSRVKLDYDNSSPAGTPCMVLEFLPGVTLEWLIKQCLHITQNPAFTASVGILIIHALEEMHEKGLIWRDLKPDNILVQRPRPGQSFIKLIDGGTIRWPAPDRITPPGFVMGTPEYMSPEEAQGDSASVDHRADYYSMGCVLYQMLSGQFPFAGENGMEIMVKHIMEEPPPLDVTPLWPLLKQLLAKKPNERPSLWRGLRRALYKYVLNDHGLAAHLGEAVKDLTFQISP